MKMAHNIPDRVINPICREFKVDYLWLAEGKGKMFLATKNSIDDLIINYHLNETKTNFIHSFLELPKIKETI